MIKSSNKNASGFTIVEILIVVAVIGILATVSIISYIGVQANARDKSVLSDLDTLDGLETECGLDATHKTACGITTTAAKAWYSGPTNDRNPIDSYLKFTPSSGNVIDVVVDPTRYCIRGYNTSSKYNTISTAATKESTIGACTALGASSEATTDSP